MRSAIAAQMAYYVTKPATGADFMEIRQVVLTEFRIRNIKIRFFDNF